MPLVVLCVQACVYLQVCSVGEIVQWVNPCVCHLGLVESTVSSEYNIVRIHIDSVTLGWPVVS